MASRSHYSVTSQDRQRGGHPVRLFVINLGCLVLLASFGFVWIFYHDLTRALPEVEHLAEYVSPAATRVYAADGSLLGEFHQEKRYPVSLEQTPQRKRVISAETAYLITSMLQSVVEAGTGRRVQSLGRSVAGKTGTSDDFHDAWFIGYTPDILTGVWIGFDKRRSLGERQTGGRVAAPIWLEFMHAATQDLPMRDFKIPEGITIMYIDPRTGLRARPGGPSLLECFRRGTEPTVLAKTRRRAVKKKKVVAKAPVYADPVLFPGLLAARSPEDGF